VRNYTKNEKFDQGYKEFETRTILARSKDCNLIMTSFEIDKEIRRIGVKSII
jgi:hypothetical protein